MKTYDDRVRGLLKEIFLDHSHLWRWLALIDGDRNFDTAMTVDCPLYGFIADSLIDEGIEMPFDLCVQNHSVRWRGYAASDWRWWSLPNWARVFIAGADELKEEGIVTINKVMVETKLGEVEERCKS